MQTESINLHHYLSRVQVRQRTGLSDEQIDQQRANGDFPDPVPFQEQHDGWIDHEIAD